METIDREYSVEEMEQKLQELKQEMTPDEIIASEAYAKHLVNKVTNNAVSTTDFEEKLAERHEKEMIEKLSHILYRDK